MYFTVNGSSKMHVSYNDRTDLLYIRLDDKKQDVINRRVSDDVVLDIGEGNKIIGIEILDASMHVTLDRLLPVKYKVSKAAV
ncbi:MAG: hypothetical protein DRH11_04980 [Deltaproteobacteria bacterium]|nr:MAG: hypothetical protein DRH11_04980 [Deltaproteobacteria bacterium]